MIVRCVPWALGAGLLFAVAPLSAQEAHLSVASQIGQSCGAAFTASALQQEAESQLRQAGIAVSRVHTGMLTTDLACVPLAAESGARSMAVHQCLALSQAVSMPGQVNGVTSATTWRQCRQYTCSIRQCDANARSGQHDLVTAFLAEFREQFTKPAQPASAAPPAQQAHPAEAAMVQIEVPRTTLKASVIIFGLYILTCVAVLIRWEWCR